MYSSKNNHKIPNEIPNFVALGGIIKVKGLQNIALKEMKELSYYKPNLEGNNVHLSCPVYRTVASFNIYPLKCYTRISCLVNIYFLKSVGYGILVLFLQLS